MDKKGNSRFDLMGFASAYKKAAPYINLFYTIVAAIILFGFVGWYLDDYLNMKPLFLLIGIFFGFLTGFYTFFKSLINLDKKGNEN